MHPREIENVTKTHGREHLTHPPLDTHPKADTGPSAAGLLMSAIEHAVRAPSGHNTQPWRFRLVGERVELYADRTRALPVVDPDDRALVLSCGAALAFLRVALRHSGFSGEVRLLPDPTDPDLLADVGLGIAHMPTERDHRRFDAIAMRRTHRAAFEPRAVPDQVLTALTEDAAKLGADLSLVVEDDLKQRAAALVAQGDRTQMSDPRFRRELADWVRSNYTRRGDGMPGYSFGIPGPPSLVGPLVMRMFDMGERQAGKDAQLAADAPALLLASTRGDTPTDWLVAGQAVGTLLLSATAEGLAASFLNQPIETIALRTPLGELLAPTGGRPQLLLRLGYPAKAYRPTPRRSVRSVVIQ